MLEAAAVFCADAVVPASTKIDNPAKANREIHLPQSINGLLSSLQVIQPCCVVPTGLDLIKKGLKQVHYQTKLRIGG